MAFSFRLQNVLDYRRGLADRMKADVASAERQLRDEESRLAELHLAREQAIAGFAPGDSGVIDPGSLEHVTIHIESLERRIGSQVEIIDLAHEAYERARSVLLALEKDAKTLEKLRERQSEDYLAELNRREQVDTSEITATFHRRFQDSGA